MYQRVSVPQLMIPPKVRTILDQNGLRALEFEAGSTPTSEKAAEMIGVEIGQIAKSVLFKGKNDQYFLIVCAGDARVSNKKLKATLGVKARMATREEAEAVTGFEPGGVCPFGLTGINIFIDNGLARYNTIFPAAGTDCSGVPMTFESLCEVSGAKPRDLC